jgi:hypothetical protein
MLKSLFKLFLLIFIIKGFLTQEDNPENHLRLLKPKPLKNSTTEYEASLKIHSKILQSVYPDSFSKNYYYTTLYIGPLKIKQKYIIDTGSSIMSSPCSECTECGPQKKNYFYAINRLGNKNKPLKCDDKICKMVPATNCIYKKDKSENKESCSYDIKANTGDGMKGYYLNEIVYFETDNKLVNPFMRQVYRSYALPIGCTTGEYGKYKELNADGILGVNNNEKSFISLLYNLKIINRNIFSLCFGLRGGYMSLGEIDSTFHKNGTINYVPLLDSDEFYIIKTKDISIGKNITINTKCDAIIDTGNSISYFPLYIYKSIIKEFENFCKNTGGKCGEFEYEKEIGYCASFNDRESLFKAIYDYWPNITIKLDKEKEYIWYPTRYYYYYLKNDQRKACLGFNSHKSDNIILGTNFIHGYDIIFDRANKKLGYILADCSRGNMVLKRMHGILNYPLPRFEDNPAIIDKLIHKDEKEGGFKLGDNTTNDMLDFIQGHNTELDFSSDFQFVNFIILVSSIIIVVVVLFIVISALMCNKRGYLKYDYTRANENSFENENEGENKISFEDNK